MLDLFDLDHDPEDEDAAALFVNGEHLLKKNVRPLSPCVTLQALFSREGDVVREGVAWECCDDLVVDGCPHAFLDGLVAWVHVVE